MEKLEEEEKKSRILIIGATGNLGFEIAKASLEASHPTFVLIRDFSPSDSRKSQKLQFLSHAGTTLLKGSLQEEESLIEAVKQVDVVISSVSSKQTLDQKLLLHVINNSGSIK